VKDRRTFTSPSHGREHPPDVCDSIQAELHDPEHTGHILYEASNDTELQNHNKEENRAFLARNDLFEGKCGMYIGYIMVPLEIFQYLH